MNSRDEILARLYSIKGDLPLEEALGPNYNLLLNFWGYYDILSGSQKGEADRLRKLFAGRYAYFSLLGRLHNWHSSILDRITSNQDTLLRVTSFEIFLIDKILYQSITPFYIKLYENL